MTIPAPATFGTATQADPFAGLAAVPGVADVPVDEAAAPRRRRQGLSLRSRRLPPEEVMHLSRQLAAFTRAGVPILDGLQVIAQETADPRMRDVLIDLSASLQRGETLSEAAAAHGDVFPPFYVGVLRSAEMTGRLDLVLDQLAGYIARDLEAKRTIRSALAYPSVIAVMSLATVMILTVFVLPRFEAFFTSFNADLPLVTRILLGVTRGVGRWWPVIAGLGLVAGLGLWAAMRRPAVRAARDRALLRAPIVGPVVKGAILERFCRILGALVRAGVALPEAMEIAAGSTTNVVYRRAIAQAKAEMLEGQGLSKPIARTGLFPGAAVQMVRVGEDTGTLDQQLETAAGFYEQELSFRIKRLTTMFEPAAIVFMGLVVGFVAIALVSAMYGIYSQVGTAG